MTTVSYRRKSLLGHTIPEFYVREAGKKVRIENESSHIEPHAQGRENELQIEEAL